MQKLLSFCSVFLLLAAQAVAGNVQVLPGGCGTGAPSSGSNSVFVDSKGNLCQVSAGSAVATAAAAAVHSITTGGTAVTVFAASSIKHSGVITNPYNATESLFVDVVNSAQVAQNGGTNGTSFELVAGQSFVVPPLSTAVTVNASTSGHAFAAYSF